MVVCRFDWATEGTNNDKRPSPAAISREDFSIAQSGFDFAKCDLGADCSASSLMASVQCVHHDSLCGLTVDQQYESSMSPVELKKTKAFRDVFTAAIRAKDRSAFGL